MPAGFPKGQAAFTTAKVIVARAFAPPGAEWKYARAPFDPDNSGHATHVAGIAAGNANTLANGLRISGIAPRAYIGNYKALTIPTDSGLGLNGNAPEIVAAIEAAVADGMDVINLSLGEPEVEPSRDIVALALDAASAAGVVPVVAAGNDFEDFGRGSVGSPGSAADAITVGATTSAPSPVIAGFSAAGPTPISLRLKPDVVAPGSSILSSQPSGWGLLSGTSMATPHVSGAVALLLQRHPDWSPEDVKAALTTTARPLQQATGRSGPTRAGAGLVDVADADAPLVRRARPASRSASSTRETTVSRSVTLEDAGGGAGPWTVTFDSSGAPQGTQLGLPPTVTVPGTLALDLVAGDASGEIAGVDRSAPRHRRAARAFLGARRAARALSGRRAHARAHRPSTRATREDTSRSSRRIAIRRFPPTAPWRRGSPAPSRCSASASLGPSRTSGSRSSSSGPGSRVEPRVVRGGDENRLTGYAALPLDQNPYVEEFGEPVPVAGALRPAARDVLRRLRQPDQGRRRELQVPLLDRRPGTAQGEPGQQHGAARRPDQDPCLRRRLRHRRPLDRRDGRRPRRARPAGRQRGPGRDGVRCSRAPSPAGRALRLPGDAQQRERRAHPPEHAHRRPDGHDRRPLRSSRRLR